MAEQSPNQTVRSEHSNRPIGAIQPRPTPPVKSSVKTPKRPAGKPKPKRGK